MATPPTFNSQYQPQPPSQLNSSFNGNYQASYLNSQNPAMASYTTPLGTATPGLPPIPPPSRLEEFGSLSLTGVPMATPNTTPGSYPNQVYSSQAPMNTSVGMTHSVFPVAQPGTYATYNYNPNPSPSSGTPSWVWIILCLLLIGIVAGGLWYYFKHRQPTPVIVPVPGIPTTSITPTTIQPTYLQPISTTTSTISTTSNPLPSIQTISTTKRVQAVDQDHHSHLRYWIS